jgi:hypothetical protein
VLRAVWHFMSILFAIIAAALIATKHHAASGRTVLLLATAIGIGGAGLIDAVATLGRHVGWPLLVLIGGFALFGV